MSKITFYLVSFYFFLATSFLSAYDATPPCFKEIERTFFNTRTILLALQYFQNDYSFQGAWDPFQRALVGKNSLISGRMRTYAKKMKPSPLEKPFDHKGAVNLLRVVTREFFMEAMKKYQPVIERDWDATFNYIFDTELERINACIAK
jgi:hypothetical protein